MTDRRGTWRLWNQHRLWELSCQERTVLFQQRQPVTVGTILVPYLAGVALVGLFTLILLSGLFPNMRGEITWDEFLIFSSGIGFLLTGLAVYGARKTVVRVDPLHLHVWWESADLNRVSRWEMVEGAKLRRWRRQLLRPMGLSAISQASFYLGGGKRSAFCPLWVRKALLVEVEGDVAPRYLLLGTNHPGELGLALADAKRDLSRRRPMTSF